MDGSVAEIRDARFRKRVRSPRPDGEYAPCNTWQRLQDIFQIPEREARIVSDTVPLRGTSEWQERELIRRAIGNRCISMIRLPGGCAEDGAVSQTIIVDRPPNWDLIAASFPHVRSARGVLYSFGSRIFNPDNEPIGPHLLAHEAVHGERQGERDAQVADWWLRYCCDDKFRLAEEVLAHVAELKWWLDNGNRRQRRRAFKDVGARLASPLYGTIIGRSAAEAILRHKAAMGDGDERICF